MGAAASFIDGTTKYSIPLNSRRNHPLAGGIGTAAPDSTWPDPTCLYVQRNGDGLLFFREPGDRDNSFAILSHTQTQLTREASSRQPWISIRFQRDNNLVGAMI